MSIGSPRPGQRVACGGEPISFEDGDDRPTERQIGGDRGVGVVAVGNEATEIVARAAVGEQATGFRRCAVASAPASATPCYPARLYWRAQAYG